jgi:hypothetical protein
MAQMPLATDNPKALNAAHRRALLTSGESQQVALTACALTASENGPPSEIEVILAGTYKTRKFSLDEKAIDQMIANHKRAGVDPALDREHESWFSFEATPAMGWVKALSKRPSSADPARMALVASVEWTDVGAAAVAAKHFRYVSAGLDLAAKDRLTGEPIGAFLDHVALVKHPFVQGMQPIANSAVVDGTGDQPMSKIALALGLAAEADENSLVEALSKRDAEHKTALAAVTKRAEDAEALLVSLRNEGVKRELDAAVAAFKITPAEREDFEALAKSDPALFAKMLAKREPKNPTATVATGNAPRTVDAKLALQEKAIDVELSADKDIDAATAYARAAAKNPALFSAEEGA